MLEGHTDFIGTEQNKDRIKGHFITNVMLKALPGGLTDVIAVGGAMYFDTWQWFNLYIRK